jgi:two-component system NtrC family sensor kinase
MFQKFSGNKCHQVLFNFESPCKGCRFGQKFNVEYNSQTYDKKTFEVTSNAYSAEAWNKNIWVHTYIDRSEELYLEQRITQNAKMKDLGLISSSIAHELNNPLGGIISYLQILQMEMAKDSPVQTDLQAMIQTSFKMKKIIEELLVFSRRPQLQNKTVESVCAVIADFLSENDLNFKSQNIKIVQSYKNLDAQLEMSKTAFKDSLHFIFQFFIERAHNIRKQKQNFTGLVEIHLFQDALKNTLRFVGNFGPLENDYKLKNVQFLAIHKTLLDQGFHVELTEPDKTWVAVDITFTRS